MYGGMMTLSSLTGRTWELQLLLTNDMLILLMLIQTFNHQDASNIQFYY